MSNQQTPPIKPYRYEIFKEVDNDTIREFSELNHAHPKVLGFLSKTLSKGAEYCLNKVINPNQMVASEKEQGKNLSYYQGYYAANSYMIGVIENAKHEHTHRLAYRAASERPGDQEG
uniref:Uncharacterized protein n=1 Tax=viral metagenome TaxID=1070528 RepID=A0A6M3L6I1_9ZZZZ